MFWNWFIFKLFHAEITFMRTFPGYAIYKISPKNYNKIENYIFYLVYEDLHTQKSLKNW